MEFRRILEVFAFQALWKKLWAHFSDLCVQKRSCLSWNSDAFWKFSACKMYRKNCGLSSTSCASKNEAVCREIQMHSGSSLPARFKEVVGALPRFVRPKTKLFALKFRRILEVFCHQDLQKTLWAQFHDLCVQKRSCLLWNSDAFWKFPACDFYRKNCGRNSMICTFKNEAVCHEIQTHSGSFLPARFAEKIVGAIPWFVRSKTKLFAVKFRRILEVFCLQDLQKNLWAQFHGLCVRKRSCLAWNLHAFWKFSACKIYRKSCGRNSTTCASKNEAVCCEVQTLFESFRLTSFVKKVLRAFLRFMRPKTKLFAVKFRRILEVLCLQDLQKKVLGAIPRFVRPKTKLFVVKFRCILEVLCLQVLKKLWAQFHDLCVQKRSCLPWNLDAFWKFSACKIYRKSCDLCIQKRSCLLWSSDAVWKFSPCKLCKKSSGCIFPIYAFKNEVVFCEIQAHFGSSCFARFVKRIRVHYHDLCVQKWNYLPDAFRKCSTSKVYRKSSGQFFMIYVSKNEAVCCEVQTHLASFPLARLIIKLWAHFHDLYVAQTNIPSWLQDFVKMLWPRFIILHTHKSLLGCSGTLWSSWLSHFITMLWIWTHFDCGCTHIVMCECDFMRSNFKKSWTGTSDMFCNIWTSKGNDFSY